MLSKYDVVAWLRVSPKLCGGTVEERVNDSTEKKNIRNFKFILQKQIP